LGRLGLALLFAAGGGSHVTAQDAPPASLVTEVRSVRMIEGDDIAFVRVDNAAEFSQSRVGPIAQDDKGFMWFGTQYGLHRFDGYGHLRFAPDTGVGNPFRGAYVYALHSDRAGRLWIGTDKGLDIFDPRTGVFSQVDFARSTKGAAAIQSITQDRSGTIWLSTSAGLYGLDPEGRNRAHFHHDGNDPRSLADDDVRFANEDRAGNFWVAHGAGLDKLERQTGRVLTHVPLREPREFGFIEDRRGTFWIYHATGGGLAVYDRSAHKLTHLKFLDAGDAPVQEFPVNSAIEDRQGNLWFGTGSDGLLRYDPDRGVFVRYRNNPADPQSLGGDDIVTLYLDRQDNIWLALHGAPLYLFPARVPAFHKVPARPATFGRSGTMVNSILEAQGRKLWVSFPSFVLAVDLATGEREDLSARLGLNSEVISMAMDARGRLWLGTVNAGLIGLEAGGKVLRFQHDPADPQSISGGVINDILVDHAGRLWLATWNGVSRLDEARGKFVNYPPPAGVTRYLSLAEDAEHQLWLGTNMHGLQRLNPATGQFVSYPSTGRKGDISNGRVNAVLVDRQGMVWVGTQNGLDVLDPATGVVRSYDTADGLPGNAVSCILQDARDGIWMGTNNGVARLDVRSGEVRSYSREDGLPGLDFTGWGSCHQSATGEMFFAGFAGATRFHPDRLQIRSQVPLVEITDLLIAGEPYSAGTARSHSQVLPDLQALTLPYSQNMFAAGFAALNFANPTSNRYRFRLVGLEDAWHSVGSDRRVASYNSLRPGSYRLEVQGAAGGGAWSAPRTLDITIRTPWWHTTGFRLFVGLALFGVAWLAYWLRVRTIAGQFHMRLEERVAERTRIARELHDSLLQGFHGLMFRLQAVRHQLPDRPEAAAQALDEALSRGDETVEQARVAVTDLRNFGATGIDLEAALRAMAQDVPMLRRADAPDCRIVVEGEARDMVPLVRDDVLQVAREAFSNAVVHARARVVQVEIDWGTERFTLRVRDDGVGLDARTIAQGREGHWGLQGIRERARQVGGILEIRSAESAGTLVELTIPAARAYARAH
jgi:ligand-binding sensor domain-containing protein/signal transduction histidine kinase